MTSAAQSEPVPRTVTRMTDVAVLPADRVVTREGDHLVIRSPGNPAHWWGNFLLFDDAPRRGDGERWEELFLAAFPELGVNGHRAYAWERTDGAQGEAQREFVSRGFALQRGVGLTAAPDAIRPHARANREVAIRALEPQGDADRELWEGAIAVQLAGNAADPDPVPDFEPFARARMRDLRALFAAGRGAWYVAIDPADGVVAGCGVVAIGRMGRFQAVDTVPAQRRRGICRRLVAEAAAHASRAHRLETLVIVAEAGYHALGIYESLGFTAHERTCGLSRGPR